MPSLHFTLYPLPFFTCVLRHYSTTSTTDLYQRRPQVSHGLVGPPESRYVAQSIRSHLTSSTEQSDGPRKKNRRRETAARELTRNTRPMARGMGKHPNITHAAAMYHQHLGIAPELPPLGPGANPGMAHQGSLLAQAPLAFCRPSGTIEAAADEMAREKEGGAAQAAESWLERLAANSPLLTVYLVWLFQTANHKEVLRI